jgi:hypothetical protein
MSSEEVLKAVALPNDVMGLILAQLPALGWARYSLVSRTWRQWIGERSLWRIRRMAGELADSTVVELSKMEGHVRIGRLKVVVSTSAEGGRCHTISARELSFAGKQSLAQRKELLRIAYGWCRLAMIVRRCEDATTWKEVAMVGLELCPSAVVDLPVLDVPLTAVGTYQLSGMKMRPAMRLSMGTRTCPVSRWCIAVRAAEVLVLRQPPVEDRDSSKYAEEELASVARELSGLDLLELEEDEVEHERMWRESSIAGEGGGGLGEMGRDAAEEAEQRVKARNSWTTAARAMLDRARGLGAAELVRTTRGCGAP